MTSDKKNHDLKKVNVFFNDEKFVFEGRDHSGSELYSVFGVPSGNKLFRDIKNPNKPDELIPNDGTIITLKSGNRFYDLPPGTVG